MAFSIMTLGMMQGIVMLRVSFAECLLCSLSHKPFMLKAIMLNVIMLSFYHGSTIILPSYNITLIFAGNCSKILWNCFTTQNNDFTNPS
jgi:hypothetical protein